jgi:hypothetical protein
MTVPRTFRRNSAIPDILVLHHADLAAADVQSGPGYRFTKPLRTILELIEEMTVEEDLIVQAIRQALERGLLTTAQIRKSEISRAARTIFDRAMEKG